MAKKRILLVDDSALFCEPITIGLSSEGYKVCVAADGGEAMKILDVQIQPFDLFILDYSMPGMNGIQFLTHARSYPGLAKIPVIMLTGSAEKETIIEALWAGVNDYVLKADFSLTALFEKVKMIIGEGSK